MSSVERIIDRHRRLQVFRAFRGPLRLTIGPIFVLYGIADYFYVRAYWVEGLVLRLLWFAMIWIAFWVLKSKTLRERFVEIIPAAILTFALWILNWMIFRSGGYASLYIIPLILTDVTGLELIGFPRRYAVLVNVLSFTPTVAIVLLTAGPEHLIEACVEISFLGGMALLAWLYKSSGDADTWKWAFRHSRSHEELESLRRTEYLKKYFPISLREKIENATSSVPTKKIMEDAVLGFADISSSTSLGNQVNLTTDWNLKEAFLEAAVKRATENNMIVLSQTGDGCFFIANYEGGNSWRPNLLAFFENLLSDFHHTLAKMNLEHLVKEPGIKFGVAVGPAMVGFIGKDQAYFTANGPNTNLAARLCSEAERDELVVSHRVWSELKDLLSDQEVQHEDFVLKGFNKVIPGYRIRPRLRQHDRSATCHLCGTPFAVFANPEGFLDVRCANNHTGKDQKISRRRKKAA